MTHVDSKEDAICRALADCGVARDRNLEDAAETIVSARRESGRRRRESY